MKITVSKRAAEERVRRSLRKEGLALRKARGRYIDQLGEYFVVDTSLNIVVDRDCNLEQLVDECEVLRPWEAL